MQGFYDWEIDTQRVFVRVCFGYFVTKNTYQTMICMEAAKGVLFSKLLSE